MPIIGPSPAPPVVPGDRELLRRLAGNQLNGEPYPDAVLDLYLAAAPRCPADPSGAAAVDVYAAAATLWTDKADERELVELAGDGAPLVTSAKQGDAAVTYARPTPAGATTAGLSAAGMRARAARMRGRSCTQGRNRSVSVLPPELVEMGRDPGMLEQEVYYQLPHLLPLDDGSIINRPEPD